jgi:hypothetical protein
MKEAYRRENESTGLEQQEQQYLTPKGVYSSILSSISSKLHENSKQFEGHSSNLTRNGCFHHHRVILLIVCHA